MTLLALALPFDFEQPNWLWLCLLIPVLAILSMRSLAGLDPVRRVLAITVRSTLIILIAACLARINQVQRNENLTVMYLMDRSHSVEQLEQKQEEFIRESVEEIPADDRVGMIDFARNAFLEQPPEYDYYLQPGRLPTMPNTDRTDIAAAVRLAMALFPHDASKRIVLMSDGNDNMGDVLSEARRARAAGIPIDVVPLWYKHRNEIYFDRMIAPSHAERGEQVPLRMVIHSDKPASGKLAIYHNGQPVELPPDATQTDLKRGNNTFFLRLPVKEDGAHSWQAVFEPDDRSMDAIAINNSARAFSFVQGKSKALIITTDTTHDQPLYEALIKENVRVEMKTMSELGDFTLVDMMSYASIILANVPAASFTEKQQRDLAIYVKDMGSGLIMTGGDESFGAGGWIGTPIEEVMPVDFEVKHKKVIPRGALAVIMHSCEIARGNYWGKEMAKKSVDTIASEDYFGVVAYTFSPGGVNWEVPLGLNTNKPAVKARIDRMQIGDMPNFDSAMQLVYQGLQNGIGQDAAQKHVIILSDGDAAAPSKQLLGDYKRAGITVSTIAIGWGMHVQQATLKDVSKRTGGQFYAARNPRQLPQIFVKESKVVRRPLIVEETFTPRIYDAESTLLGSLESGGMPPLDGMILTSVKKSPYVEMPLIRASDDGDDPILAHWQYQLGKAVAFTSGYWPYWGEGWTGWDKFAKFWAQVVRWSMRQESGANFETFTQIDGGKGRVVVDALDDNAQFMNFLELESKIVGPSGNPIPLKFTQTGPGHYEAEFDAEESGQYLANVQVLRDGKPYGSIKTGATIPFSPEYRDLRPNEAMLRQIVDITGGRWLDVPADQADVFSHDLPPTESRRAAWEWVLAWLLLPLFLLDVAVRRLASWLALSIAVELVVVVFMLFGLQLIDSTWYGILGVFLLAELIGWTIRFQYIGPLFEYLTHGVTALNQAGEQSVANLDKLKGVREKARDDMRQEKPEYQRIQQEGDAGTKRRASRKFEADAASGDLSVGNLGETLGGPGTPAAKNPPKPAAPGDEGKQEGGMTSRLLRSKRKREQDSDE
ncbi:MAG: VWA domain-containing protein [Phycisphaerae bacterium]